LQVSRQGLFVMFYNLAFRCSIIKIYHSNQKNNGYQARDRTRHQ
jgi:hypothetical protein